MFAPRQPHRGLALELLPRMLPELLGALEFGDVGDRLPRELVRMAREPAGT
jgi:hypothetical protein